MSGYLNEYEVEDCLRIFSTGATPNLHTGTLVIYALMEWTNSCSDGWPYWQKPRQAATKLITELDEKRREYLRGHVALDIRDDYLKDLLKPIKSFLTKQGIDWNAELPWAAILPVHATAVAVD